MQAYNVDTGKCIEVIRQHETYIYLYLFLSHVSHYAGKLKNARSTSSLNNINKTQKYPVVNYVD